MMNNNIIDISTQNRKTFLQRKRTPLSLLKSITDANDTGQLHNGRPKHFNTSYGDGSKPNAKIEDFLQELVDAKKEGRKPTMFLSHGFNKTNLAAHSHSLISLYFAGNGYEKEDYSIVMLDVDCQKNGSDVGSKEGAAAFLAHLRNNHFPELYSESSTNGNGGHGYLVIHKCELDAEAVNTILKKQLEPWLNEQAQGFDVQFVEVKGTLPVVKWQDGKPKFTAGQLAKVPRGMIERFDEIKNTTLVDVTEFRKLKVSERVSSSLRAAPSTIHTCGVDFGCGPSAGSSGSHYITDELLKGLQDEGVFSVMAESLMKSHSLGTSGKMIATTEDVSIFLMLGKFFSENMNENGTLPVARFKQMWKALFECGEISRGWHDTRFKVVRDYVSSLDLIDWKDKSYEIPSYTAEGKKINGRACKWQFSESFINEIESCEQGIRQIKTVLKTLAKEKETLLCKGGRHPLYQPLITTTKTYCQSLTRLSSDETTKPEMVVRLTTNRHPDETIPIVGYYQTAA